MVRAELDTPWTVVMQGICPCEANLEEAGLSFLVAIETITSCRDSNRRISVNCDVDVAAT